jgi:phosphoribosylaminoimidazole-succinocarboxamide synthase
MVCPVEAKHYTIGELASSTGLTVRTLHHYDRIGLLVASQRTHSGYRLYGRKEVQRLYRILALRQLGLALNEIRTALDGDSADLQHLIARQLDEVQRQVKVGRALERKLRRLLDLAKQGQVLTNDQFIDTMEVIVSQSSVFTQKQREERTALASKIGLPRVAAGKVRELFDAGEHLLMVATDRISVFDVVLPTPIPDRGAVLTGLSVFWFGKTASILPNHLVEWRSSDFPPVVDAAAAAGRAMLVRRADMVPLECVVRGYLAGSGWKDYQRTGKVCGIALPPGLHESDRLPEPIFTPSTKATVGHDENIDMEQASRIVGDDALIRRIARVSVELYEAAATHAESKGIILADTKFEFGLVDGQLTLCDEAFTPDSSRYWPKDQHRPGESPPSFDKQFVRDYVDGLGWNKAAPGPELPSHVVDGTSERYREAYERISGARFDDYLAGAGALSGA